MDRCSRNNTNLRQLLVHLILLRLTPSDTRAATWAQPTGSLLTPRDLPRTGLRFQDMPSPVAWIATLRSLKPCMTELSQAGIATSATTAAGEVPITRDSLTVSHLIVNASRHDQIHASLSSCAVVLYSPRSAAIDDAWFPRAAIITAEALVGVHASNPMNKSARKKWRCDLTTSVAVPATACDEASEV